MARVPRSLLAAASISGQEDRLTDIFATVLRACDELATKLFAELELPAGDRFEVLTQVQVTRGERPDMVVYSLEGSSRLAQLWSEHKVGAGFGDMQRERYLAALDASPIPGKLICIVEDGQTSREEGQWRGFTWQEIGELAEAVGRESLGRDWREKALVPTAPAKWRLLYELLWYLEEVEGLAVTHALDDTNLDAFKLMDETWRAVGALVERASQNAEPLRPSGKLSDYGMTRWQQFEPRMGSWLARLNGVEAAAELVVSDRDYWSPDRLDEPAFAAGYSLEGRLHDPLSARREWVRELDEAEYCFVRWEDHVCVCKTLTMREVLAFGNSLKAQGEGLGHWARDAIIGLGRHDPGDLSRAAEPGPVPEA